MGLFDFIVSLFSGNRQKTELKAEKTELYEKPAAEAEKTVYSLWDFIQFRENTQAFHLANTVGFDEWVDMTEIRRRIEEIFRVSYKNERSLYPYIKTLVDAGFFETSNIGGRMKWRKKELLFDTEQGEKQLAEPIKRKIRASTS